MIKILGVFFVIAMACYLRLGVIANTEIENPIRADAYDYYKYAYNLKQFGTYSRTDIGEEKPKPDSFRSPGYPFFLIPLIEWPPSDYMLLKINLTQAILGLLTLLLAWLIYLRLVSFWYAFAAAFLTAISPHLVSFTAYLLTETLFTFLLVLLIWLGLLAYERKNLLFIFFFGALMASGALTRPSLNYFFIFVCAFLFIQFGNRDGIKYALSMLLGFILVFSPWVGRNFVMADNVKEGSLVINTIHHGMYPDFMYRNLEESKGFPYHFDPDSPKISENINSLTDELYNRFHHETWRHLKWYLIGKPITLFSWGILNGWGDIFIYPVIKSPYFDKGLYKLSRLFMYWAHWVLIFLSICACIVVWLPKKNTLFDHDKLFAGRLISILIMYFLALHIIAAPFPRYSVPLRPFNYGMAIFFISFIVSRLSNVMALYKNNGTN